MQSDRVINIVETFSKNTELIEYSKKVKNVKYICSLCSFRFLSFIMINNNAVVVAKSLRSH